MDKPGIIELLIDCVLDPALLRRVQEAPESVFAEYALDDHAREVLASPDTRLLELLGDAVRQQAGDDRPADTGAPAAAPESGADAETAAFVSLPESQLALRLVPYLQQEAVIRNESLQLTVNYAGHLDQLPAGLNVDELPDAPAADLPGQPLPPLTMVVTVQPRIWTDAAGNRQITFSVGARLPQDLADSRESHAAGEPGAEDLTPWRHDVSSPAVIAAAERVHSAADRERRQRLFELIETMIAPASVTEAGT